MTKIITTLSAIAMISFTGLSYSNADEIDDAIDYYASCMDDTDCPDYVDCLMFLEEILG